MRTMTNSGREARDAAPSGRKSRVIIVDDHTVMRQGLVMLLQTVADIEVIGAAPDGQTAIDMTKDLKPDVVVMDASMPGMNGIEATRIITERFPDVRVVGLSMYDEAEMGARLREAGAVCYVQKSRPAEDLIAAVREAMKLK